MCNEQDVDPIHENHLQTVYSKLTRLYIGGDNYLKAMNSKRLTGGLTFTVTDRITIHTQIINAYPNMMYRFNHTNNPSSFTYSNSMTEEILSLFKPST